VRLAPGPRRAPCSPLCLRHSSRLQGICVLPHARILCACAHSLLKEQTMTQTEPARAATRLVGGAELPAPGRWQIDPGHAQVAFTGRPFMLTKVRGRFAGVTGAIHVADVPDESTAEVTIDMASVDSGSGARDEHLRSADLFDVERHPTATFCGRAAGW